jgi:hypothetical protein
MVPSIYGTEKELQEKYLNQRKWHQQNNGKIIVSWFEVIT